MRGWIRDLAYSLRLLRKSPGFSVAAVLCLGLGIGVNASVFSLVNYIFLRPMPVFEPERLVVLSRGGSPLISHPDYRDLRDRSRSLEGLAASNPTESSLDFDGSSHSAGAEAVSMNYPSVIGVRQFLGRWFLNDDEPAMVVSYRAWQQLFHGDPNILGRRVRSETQWYTVVGVAPEEFGGIYLPLKIDLWVPFHVWARQYANVRAEMENRASPRVMVFGRLRAGVEPRQAASELNVIAEEIRKENPGAQKTGAQPIVAERVRGIPNPNGRGQSTPIAALLLIVVGLVLLIACVNVGNLLLARGVARRRELSIRVATGAPRARLLRQLLTESLILAVFGGAAGVLLGNWMSRLLETLIASSLHAEFLRVELPMDARVLGLTAALSLLTTLIFGLAPAWQASRTDVMAALRGETPAGGRYRLRQVSLAGQVCLSLVLLLTAGLFLRSVMRLGAADPGFAIEDRLNVSAYASPPEFTPETARQFYTQALDRLRTLPGVKSAALTNWFPLQPINPGCAALPGGEPLAATENVIDAGYLRTMRIPLVAGRNFDATDRAGGKPVVIVNQTLARRLWPQRSPLGKQVQAGCRDARTFEVIGVARDSKFRSLRETVLPHIYHPFSQDDADGLVSIVVETASDPGPMTEPVRKTLLAINPAVRIYGARSLKEHVGESYWAVRWEAWTLAIFGGLALVLAAVGLYGVIAYQVTMRTREIGIRMAIGAWRGDVFRLVLGQGMRPVLIGLALGVAAAAGLARLMGSLLYGVSPTDLLTYTAAVSVWMIVALAACYVPSRRAAKVEPVAALRHE